MNLVKRLNNTKTKVEKHKTLALQKVEARFVETCCTEFINRICQIVFVKEGALYY